VTDEHGSSRTHPWHCIVIDDLTPDGWPVRCIPHGLVGIHQDRVQAFLMALEHDAAYGGDTWK
jgi:hypothetical protein